MTNSTTDFERPTRFLTVTGVLRPDGRLYLHPGFVTEDPSAAVDAPDSPLVAELVDDEGAVLLRVGVPVGPFAAELPSGRAAEPSVRGMPDLAVAGLLPYPESTRRIRFSLRGVLIHEVEVSEHAPEIAVEWDLPREPEGVQRIRWSSSEAEGRPLAYVVAYSNDGGATWQPLSLPSPATELEVDFAQLPGGRGRLRILATDGTLTSSVDSPVVRLARRPCIPTILEPADGAELVADTPILLHGQGYYLEERRVELEQLAWSSSLDGALGRGAVLQAALRPGRHRISLEAGSGKRRAETSVTIRVVRPAPDSTAG
jgi:hypothetical protein